MRHVAPWIHSQAGLSRRDYEVISVMREPIDWLGSWYRYRTREDMGKAARDNSANYTGGVSFDQFVRDVCKPKNAQPIYARLGSPCGVAMDGVDSIGVDRLYPYEDMFGLFELVAERTGKTIDLPLLNVSPSMELELSDEARAQVKEKFAFAFDLHASLNYEGTVDPRFRKKKNKAANEAAAAETDEIDD